MNTKLFKHIFSKRLNALVVVGENAHSDGKKTGHGVSSVEKLVISTNTMSPNRFFGLLSLGFICVSSALADPVMDALPTNGVVVQGAASITQQTNLMTINQATDKAVINWQGFDIGHGATVNVVQPNSQSVLLNRVVGSNASQIFGTLNANGHVILVNPNGIVFGADGSVNASAFTASTLGITDADFMAGNYYFTANGSNGTIVNQGSINTNGGYVALLGASVTNDGKITTNYGNAYLGAAESILLPITNSGRIKMELSPASINAAVNNTKNGLIVTAGGQVLMQASAVNDAVAMGMITNAGHIDTTAAQAGDVNLLTDGGNIRVSGSINASSQDSTKAGGQIIIGRDLETNILASSTDASGAMLTSKGGFVETSGAYLVTTGTRVWAKEWLLDPFNITISNTLTTTAGATGLPNYTPNADSTILASDIVANLNAGTSVSILTGLEGSAGSSDGNITVDAAIAKTAGGDATLTLTANNGIFVNQAISATGVGKLNVNMTAHGNAPTATNSRGIVMNSTINANGGVVTLQGTNRNTNDGATTGSNLTSGVMFNSGSGITAARFNVTGIQTVAAANNNNGIRFAGTTSFNSTEGTSVMNGTSHSFWAVGGNFTSHVGVLFSNGTNTTFNSGGGSIILGGVNAEEGMRIGGSDTTAVINTSGNVTLGSAGSGFFHRGGTLNASGTLNIIGSRVRFFGGTNYRYTDATAINIASQQVDFGMGSTASFALATGATHSNINVNTNSLTFSGSSAINAGTGSIRLDTFTAGQQINIGGANTTGVLGVSATAISRLTAANTIFGSATTGNITVSSAITTSSQNGNITIETPANIAINANLSINPSRHLTLNATGANSVVSQSAGSTITASGVRLLGSEATYALSSTSNAISTIAADVESMVLNNASALTIGTVANAVGITSHNGAVSLGSAQTIGGAGNISSGSGDVTFNTANGTGSYSGVISGTGEFIKSGAGTTVLTNNSTYTGATRVSGGTLQVGNNVANGSLGATSGVTLLNNATLAFNKNVDTTIDKNIVGNGNVTANITGNLVLASNILLTEVLPLEANNTINLTASNAITQNSGLSLASTNLWMTATNTGIGVTGSHIQTNVDNLRVTAGGDIFVTEANSVTVAGSTSANNGSINISTTNGTMSVGTANSVSGLTAHGTGNITLLANATSINAGNGMFIANNITALGGDVSLSGTTADTTTRSQAGILSSATVRAKNITLAANATGITGNALGYYGAGGIFNATELLSLTGNSESNNVGFYSFGGSFTSGLGMTITGTSELGIGVGLDSHVTINNTGANGILITGTGVTNQLTDDDGNTYTETKKAISLRGSAIINTAGNVTLNAIDGDIISDAGNPDWSSETGVNTITNSGAGSINVTAGTNHSSQGEIDGSVLSITQNGSGGVLVKTSGEGYVTMPNIVNAGNGNVVVAAGASLPAGDAFGGQVSTVASSQITSSGNGNVFIYSGYIGTTGDLSDTNAAFDNLAFAGSGITPNAQMNTAFGGSINSGPKMQVLFRQNGIAQRGRNIIPKFDLSLSNIAKFYGDVDLTGLDLINAFKSAYAASVTAGDRDAILEAFAGGNTFQMLASTAIEGLTASDTNLTLGAREVGENVRATPYAFTNITGGTGVNVVDQVGLLITPRTVTIRANAISATYSGASYQSFADLAGFTIDLGSPSLTFSGSITSIDSIFRTGLDVGLGSTLTGTTTAPAGDFNRTISNAIGTGLDNYTITYVGNTGSIAKAPISILIDNVNTTYGTIKPLTFSVTGLVNNETLSSAGINVQMLTTSGYTSPSTTDNVGSYAITTATTPNSSTFDNYTLTNVTNGNLSITPATLTFTAQGASKLVTQADPALAFSVSGLVNGDTDSVIDAPNISRAIGEIAGTYAINLAGGSASNYNIVRNNGLFTVIGADKLLITMAPTTTTYGTLGASVITKAEYAKLDTNNNLLTFFNLTNSGNNIWSDGVGASITITPTLTGVSVLTNVGTYVDAVTNTNTGTATSAGNFNAVITQAANYQVTPAALTIAANDFTRVYDGTGFTSATATATGFKNDQDFAALGGLTFSGLAMNSINAGLYNFGVTANNPNANYTITYGPLATLTTTQATLSITGNSLNTLFNGQQQSVTGFSVTGLRGTDTVATLTGISALGASGTNVGSYINVVNVVDQTNYLVTGINGLLQIAESGQPLPQPQPQPFVNPVTPKPIAPIDPSSQTATANAAGTFQLARNVRLYAPEQCADNTGLDTGIDNENCECQNALFNDESLCRVVAEESGPELLSAVTPIERSNTN